MTSEAIGTCATPPYMVPMPTSANAPGSMPACGSRIWAASPNAPPKRPPMTMPGAKSPALPPEPIVSAVPTILSPQSRSRSCTPSHPEGNQLAPLKAICAAP